MAATRKGAQKGGPRRSTKGGADRFRVRRLDQMRALAHPLRLQLLEIFAAEECTTKQAALRLGERPTRLYHHVAALERAGLIRLQRTRPNRGTTEKYYRAVSPFFEVDPALATKKSERRMAATQGEAMARDVLHSALQDLRHLDWKGRTEEERPLLARVQMRISPRDAARVREGLITWLREQQKKFSGSPDPDTPGSTLTLAFFPSVRRIEPATRPAEKRGRK